MARSTEGAGLLPSQFFIAASVSAVLVLLLILINLIYIYGTCFHQSERAAAIHILAVDYDGGLVGRSLLAAYQHLRSHSFPTLVSEPQARYTTPDSIIQAVRNRDYWAAIYTSHNASDSLSMALRGGSASTSYQSTDALTYVWNEARYPTASDSIVMSSLNMLVQGTRQAYHAINGTDALFTLTQSDPGAVQVYLEPIDATRINVNPMPQGSKNLYNTVSMVTPILQQFFYCIALSGMFAKFRIYDSLSIKSSGSLRAVISVVYTFVGALCMTGYIWMFREDWHVHGYQFVETWLILWMLMHIYFCLVDAAVLVLPQPSLPFVVVTWIFLNVSATISPFELTPGFYRWGQTMPAYSAYQMLTYVWTDGPAPKLYQALPIMFAWWLVGLVCAVLSHRRKCQLMTGGHVAARTSTSLSCSKAEVPAPSSEEI